MMNKITVIIFRFLLTFTFFTSVGLISFDLQSPFGKISINFHKSELNAKRDQGIDLPFPENEMSGMGKPVSNENIEIIHLLPKSQTKQENTKNSIDQANVNTNQETKNLSKIKKIDSIRKTKKQKLSAKIKKIDRSLLALNKEKIGENTQVTPEKTESIEKITQPEEPKKLPETLPKYIKGLYVTNHTLFDKNKFAEIKKKARETGINTFVIDVQPKPISKEILDSIHKENFYTVARIVNFDGGLKNEFPTKKKLEKLKTSVKTACESGFKEIQFDYIRYSDKNHAGINIKKKYQNISSIIEDLKNAGKNCNNGLIFGADLFGRIPFVKHDRIGQNLENMSANVDVIYPMLYPSHFYGQKQRINNPYQTVFDGVTNSIKRAKKSTRIVPYIQGFSMAIKGSKLSLKDYIKAQVKAAKESNSHGFVVWNAKNDYKETFRALAD